MLQLRIVGMCQDPTCAVPPILTPHQGNAHSERPRNSAHCQSIWPDRLTSMPMARSRGASARRRFRALSLRWRIGLSRGDEGRLSVTIRFSSRMRATTTMLSTEFRRCCAIIGGGQAMALRDDQCLSFPQLLVLAMIVGVTLSLVGAAWWQELRLSARGLPIMGVGVGRHFGRGQLLPADGSMRNDPRRC